DIDASITSTSTWDDGSLFNPLGMSASQPFKGVFEGLGHSITGLKVYKETSGVGLFGYTNNALIRNTKLENISVSGISSVGGLAGYGVNSVIENGHTSGTVQGEGDLGGLTGLLVGGAIYDSSSEAHVYPRNIQTVGAIGGLLGRMSNSVVKNSFAKGQVSGNFGVGGLIGWVSTGVVESSYALTEISATDMDIGAIYFGGLIGLTNKTSVTNSFAQIKMRGLIETGGGLIGSASYTKIDNSYVSGDINVIDSGGIIGNGINMTISNSFSNISNSSEYGRLGIASNLIGTNYIKNTYWNASKTPEGVHAYLPGATAVIENSKGLTDQQMTQSRNFEGFNFS
ncbi:MAG: hypothetical protein EBQ97_08005, partial [Bacteroidetes bacterium]|nr:hypothetical protein [Bacteroidota bacterium]